MSETLALLLLLLRLSSQVVSSTRLRVDNHDAYRLSKNPHSWLAEPGPLKVVAIDTGAGLVQLNPDDGGVVVAVVKADVTVKDNRGLYIYPSTKQVQVTGCGFEDRFRVRLLTSIPRSGFSILDGIRARVCVQSHVLQCADALRSSQFRHRKHCFTSSHSHPFHSLSIWPVIHSPKTSLSGICASVVR